MTKGFFSNLLVVSLFAATTASCEKDNNDANVLYGFSAKLDGVENEFSVLTDATKAPKDGLYNLSLTGIGATESISLSLWSYVDDFIPGKTFTIDSVGGKPNVMAYGPNGTTDSTSSYYSFFLYGTVLKELNCTITETTSTGIKGTFSGKLYKNQPGNPQEIEVTDGIFYARF